MEAYRLDLDRRVDGGASWMLGAWVAHLLLAENRLAMRDDAADTAIFATGEVAFAAGAERRAEVRTVAHITEKVERLAEQMAEEEQANRHVVLLTPESNKDEAEVALGRLSMQDRVTLHAVSETAVIPDLLDSNVTLPAYAVGKGENFLKRYRGGRITAALVLCVLVGIIVAGYAAWRNVERGWDELLRAGRYLELERSLAGFVLSPLAAHYRKRLRERPPAAYAPVIVVTARRPADGGSCAGLRFRGGGMKDFPVKAVGGTYRIEELRSFCGFTVMIAGGRTGHVWLLLELLRGEGAPTSLEPARRAISGALTDRGLRLFQELPLYLEESWSWRISAAWAPVHSEDLERQFGRGFLDDALLARWKGFGVSVVRMRISLHVETLRHEQIQPRRKNDPPAAVRKGRPNARMTGV